MISLYEFDRDEWWDICRTVRPDLTEDQFDDMWRDFLILKSKRRSECADPWAPAAE